MNATADKNTNNIGYGLDMQGEKGKWEKTKTTPPRLLSMASIKT